MPCCYGAACNPLLHPNRFLFWVDLVSVMPFDAIVAAACGVEYVGNQLALYIAILKWFNMVRTHTGLLALGKSVKK